MGRGGKEWHVNRCEGDNGKRKNGTKHRIRQATSDGSIAFQGLAHHPAQGL